jgi:hypothetical protein
MTAREKTHKKAGRAGLPEIFPRPLIPQTVPTGHLAASPPPSANRATRRAQARAQRKASS